jgi:two-component system response regulator AgrA
MKGSKKMIHVLIYDDSITTSHKIENIIRKTYEQANFKNFNIQIFNKSYDILSYVKENDTKNIYILDIELNEEKNGLVIGREIRKLDKYLGEMIFVTNHLELSFKVFQYKLRALNFIDKNFQIKSQLKESILIATQILSEKKNNLEKKLEIKVGSQIFNIPFSDIVYIETIKGSRKVSLCSINTLIEFYSTLKELKVLLDDNFLQIHKTTIVNKKYIKSICKNHMNHYVELTTGTICMLSRTGLKEVT